MSKLSKLWMGVGVLGGVVLVGIVLSRGLGKGREGETPESVSEPTFAAAAETNRSAFFAKRAGRGPSQTVATAGPMSVSSPNTNGIPGWEDRVEEILGSASPDSEKARQMLEMFPRLPAAGQEEVARHLSNLVPDQDYGLMRTYLTNASLPEDVLSVLLDDALNRPNSLKLPTLLEIARSVQHPNAAEAKDFLELILEEDYGNDWDKWQAKMDEWLKDNPD